MATIHGVLTEERSTNGQLPLTTKMTPTQGPLQVIQLYVPGLGAPHFKFSSFMSLKATEQIQSNTPHFT